MAQCVLIETPLTAGPKGDSELLATLAVGDVFETLDIASGRAWGIAPAQGLVGYIDQTALEKSNQADAG